MDIRRSLNKTGINYKMIIVKNREEAIDILNGDGDENPEGLPDIVLIDLNLPKRTGFELLSTIRNTENWKDLKCFIITTSDEKADREMARSLRVSGYIVKPIKISTISSIDSYNLMIDLMNLKK
jgi:CheY-like chemotaxis protein